MESLIQDIRYGIRVLAKKPAFVAVAVLALAVGIGANTAIFSFVDALLVRPLRFNNLDRLMMVWSSKAGTGEREEVSPGDFADWKNQSTVFEQLAAYRWSNANLTGGGEPERVQGFQVTPSFFAALDVQPLMGRTLLPEEAAPGHDQVAVLSHGLWQRRFAADPAIINQTIQLNGRGFTVVGVMPPDVDWPPSAELWTPLAMSDQDWNARDYRYFQAVGRLKPGVSMSAAETEMNVIAQRIAGQYPDTNKDLDVMLRQLPGQVSDDFTRPFLLALMGAVGFVLLIACANVANLQLARAMGRNREIAIRTALGASRWRILRQLLTESVMLSLLGAVLGLLLALWGIDLIKTSIPLDEAKYVSGLKYMGLNGRALGFTLIVALLTGIIAGLAPALQASRPDLNETLKEGGRSSTAGGSRHRLRSLLVVGEIALALVLLVGTGLMVKAFARLLEHQKQGFDAGHLLTLRISLPDAKYKDEHQQRAFYNQLLERAATVPAVESVGLVSALPSSGEWNTASCIIEDRPPLTPTDAIKLDFEVVSPGYLRTMRIPLVSGRELNAQDGDATQPVVIISQAMARRYWPNENPIGKRIKVGIDPATTGWRVIVGVAGDIRHFLFDPGPRLTLYLPHTQSPRASLSLVARTTTEPLGLVSAMRAQIARIDPDQPIYLIKTMETIIDEHVAGVRISAALMAIFGAMALVLAAVGVYSVMAYSVSQRTHEIGVRMALGATSRDVLQLVVGQAMKMAALGLIVGLPIAFALMKLMTSAFFGLVGVDLMALAALTAMLALVALASGYIPARRATKVDPMVALRYE